MLVAIPDCGIILFFAYYGILYVVLKAKIKNQKQGELAPWSEDYITASALEKSMPRDCPFSVDEIMKLRKFMSKSMPKNSINGDCESRFAYGGYLHSEHKTVSRGYHDEFESTSEMILFRRPSDSWKVVGEPLEPGDRRIEKLAFITKRAKSATILHEGSRYHVITDGFLGIPGTTIITYEYEHRENGFVTDLL